MNTWPVLLAAEHDEQTCKQTLGVAIMSSLHKLMTLAADANCDSLGTYLNLTLKINDALWPASWPSTIGKGRVTYLLLLPTRSSVVLLLIFNNNKLGKEKTIVPSVTPL